MLRILTFEFQVHKGSGCKSAAVVKVYHFTADCVNYFLNV